jgi:acetyl-CoA C-acetyltransferase
VLVGVGTSTDAAEATELMVRALLASGTDAGRPGLLAMLDRIAVPQGSWDYPDPGRLVAAGVGARSARTHFVELGIPQQSLINDALAAIADGASEVAAVVGGEARRWARDQARSGGGATQAAQPGAVPDVVHRRPGPLMEPVEVVHRLWEPVQQYAMIDNALRAADRQSMTGHRDDVARLWSRFNRVAQDNPAAAFPAAMTPDQIAEPSAANRPLAFPYNKWHASQWTVDQAAALLFCSVEVARRLQVPAERWIFPLVGVESSHAVSLLRRQDPHRWPAMGVLARAAEGRVARRMADVEVIEVYSCFPAAVRVQQRELGLARSGTPTVTGGMAFAGGPFNNFVLQSTAEVVRRLRDDPEAMGAVTTVSGLLTKPGVGVWAGRPDGRPALVADLAGESAAVSGVVDLVEELGGYTGGATVVTYTVTFDGLDPVRTVALCRTDDGRRCVALSDDPALAEAAVDEELIGARVAVREGALATP